MESDFLDFQSFGLKTSLIDREVRLNASSYSLEYAESRRIVEEISRRAEVVKIEDLTRNIFHRPRFKRLYTGKKNGLPFLMPTDVFMFPLKPRKFIMNPPEGLSVEKGWILVTCSGTVGRTIITTKQISNCVLSHDIIRVVPEKLTGYIYAYLNTWIGQAFLTKDQYGATVKHIEPEHVANVPIPRIPEVEKEVHEKVMKAYKMIEKAQDLLLEAERMIYTELGLPEIDEDEIEYFGGEDGRIANAFTVSSKELDYRLDASYHNPLHRAIKVNLSRVKHKLNKLKNLSECIFIPPRIKRPYSDREFGIPFLSGTHLVEVKFYDLKYINKFYKRLESFVIRKDWILISARGTVGRPFLVTDLTDGWTASDNIIRILSKKNTISPGYLWAFLSSIYAQTQINSFKAGSVQDLLQPSHLEDILVPVPPKDIQDEIGNRVIQAYDLRDSAIWIEEEAVKQLEQKILELAGSELS